MKKKYIYIVVLLISISIFSSCKKEGDDQLVPEQSNYTINTPPSGSYYIGAKIENNYSYAYWTTDFVIFNKLTTQFSSVGLVRVEDSTVLLTSWGDGKSNIYYAPLSDLSSFNKVTYDYSLAEITILNGVIMVYAIDGNNNYTGYCNTKAGETSIKFTLLPTSVWFSGFKNIGSVVVANSTTNGSSQMAYTIDGKTWNVPGTLNGAGTFDAFGGKIWRFGSSGWDFTSSTDLSTATWTNDFIDYQSRNTSDTVGSFNVGSFRVVSKNDWRIFGAINSNSGNYPCVNISTDQGQTWHKTELLKGISNFSGYLQNMRSTTSASLFVVNYQELYSANNGIDFTEITDSKEIEDNNNFFGEYVR